MKQKVLGREDKTKTQCAYIYAKVIEVREDVGENSLRTQKGGGRSWIMGEWGGYVSKEQYTESGTTSVTENLKNH